MLLALLEPLQVSPKTHNLSFPSNSNLSSDYTIGEHRRYTEAIGWTVPLARSTATAIKLNSALILLTVLRNLLSWYNPNPFSPTPLTFFLQVEKFIRWVLSPN